MQPLPPAQKDIYEHHAAAIGRAAGFADLVELAPTMVGALLRREADLRFRAAVCGEISRFVRTLSKDRAGERLLRQFLCQVVALVLAMRPHLAVEAAAAGALRRRAGDAAPAGGAPVIVAAPAPVTCTGFPALVQEAVVHRAMTALSFFQRHNPALARPGRRPFLLSPLFALRFSAVLRRFVAPAMLRSRPVALLATNKAWEGIDSASFWRQLSEAEGAVLTRAWELAWEEFRLVPGPSRKGSGPVMRRPPELVEIRQMLASDEYDLPKIDNQMLELFTRLPWEFDRGAMEDRWKALGQVYRQEFDRGTLQEEARPGAFRDLLLDCFEGLPDDMAEFMVLLCYYNFPNLTRGFLLRFIDNRGRDDAAKRANVPYLMWFLEQTAAAQRADANPSRAA